MAASMDMTGDDKTANQPQMIIELCNHLAKSDLTLSTNLCKTAFNFLSTSNAVTPTAPTDEQYVVVQIKQILENVSKDNGNKFELLYTNLTKSNVLQNRTAILSFLLKLAKAPQKGPKWTSLEKLESFPSSVRLRPNLLLKSGNSQESVQSIFHGNSAKSFQSSASNIQSSRMTTNLSTVWSKSELIAPTLSGELVTERDVLLDVIYSLQGIEGKFLRREAGSLGFIIDPKLGRNLSPIQRGLVERLIGTSFLHNQIKQFCDNNEKQNGIVCQALTSTFHDELSNYYKAIAILQASSRMTLRKALVYLSEHHVRFEWLAYLAEKCSEKKGGALITAVYGFLQHGGHCVQEVSEKVLCAVCKPMYIMLFRWLLDGEINDPCNEFFIEARDITAAERLWYDKYYVRESMVPSFISMEQANKILATGKSINFLRQICKDGEQLPGRDSLQKLSKSESAEALFAPERSIEFHSTLEKFYRETSLRVLNLLQNKYRLYEHLQSLRRYLLLGQGDFIRHLLELLEPELNKPAQQIYGHTLSAILESAIRVTNAQFEDEDTLKRLNVSFMGHSQGDTGWDVFSLVYIVDGPVGTIFQPTMATYQCLFGALWKAKRMEFVLSNMRKQQIAMSKTFRRIKELKPVMHVIHLLTSQMIHFLAQTQYYFLFEVLECSWAEMLRQVNQAGCLDDIISAHTSFLGSVQCGVLLDENSRALFQQLRSIYNFVLTLDDYQACLNAAAAKEYEDFVAYRTKIETFGTNSEEELVVRSRIVKFQQLLGEVKTKVKHLGQSYELFVKKYLKLLSANSNMNLQLLSVRLSFNDYYEII